MRTHLLRVTAVSDRWGTTTYGLGDHTTAFKVLAAGAAASTVLVGGRERSPQPSP